jgi:hypothetical protein
MDILKILESFEELLYRLALWVILLPKTLFFVFRSPGSINKFVTAELPKTSYDQFQDRLSPVLFWVLTALIPYLMLIDFVATLPGSRVATEAEWIAFIKAPFITRLTLVAVVALAGPLAISDRTLRALGKPVNRESLRLVFFVQCYCLTPVYILLLPFIFLALRYNETPDGPATYIEGLTLIAAAVWFLFTESLVLADQLSIPRYKAAVKAGSYALVTYAFLFLLELLTVTLFNGLSIWMKE